MTSLARRVIVMAAVLSLVIVVITVIDMMKYGKGRNQALQLHSGPQNCTLSGKLYSPGATVRTVNGGVKVCREGTWKAVN